MARVNARREAHAAIHCAPMNPPPQQPSYPPPGKVLLVPGADRRVDDVTLVSRMGDGDEQALGTFYDRWHPLVHAVVHRIVRNADDVEDVVEEAFWQAWRQAERYAPARGSVQTWLLTIARSRALDRVRGAKRLREDYMEDDAGNLVVQLASDADPVLDAESAERRRIVMDALTTLPDEQRQALELGYYAGLSQSEIAQRTGQPLGTIKTRMRLAMQKLRERLQVLREEAQ